MAKKKKNLKVEAKPQGVAYSGQVKIQFIRDNKVYKTINQHNEGTSGLFKYLAQCAIGDCNQSDKPQYIHTYYCKDLQAALDPADESARNKLWTTANRTCSVNVPRSTAMVKQDDDSTSLIYKPYIAYISFMIPAQQISGKTNVICLYSNTAWGDYVQPLAYIILSEEEASQFEVGDNNTSNILITWQLRITNQLVSQEA